MTIIITMIITNVYYQFALITNNIISTQWNNYTFAKLCNNFAINKLF